MHNYGSKTSNNTATLRYTYHLQHIKVLVLNKELYAQIMRRRNQKSLRETKQNQN